MFTSVPFVKKLKSSFTVKTVFTVDKLPVAKMTKVSLVYEKGTRKVFGELHENRRTSECNCLKSLENIQKCDLLQIKIRQGKERNRIIRLVLEEKRRKRAAVTKKLTELLDKNNERSEKLKAYKTKSEALEDCVSKKFEDVSVTQDKLKEIFVVIRRLARLRVEQLLKYVFPISLVKPTMEMESSGDSMVKELAEALQTT